MHSARTLLILCVIVFTVNYQCSKLGYRIKMNSTLRQTSSFRMSRRIRAVEHRCAAGIVHS